jgi:hypothetical protein
MGTLKTLLKKILTPNQVTFLKRAVSPLYMRLYSRNIRALAEFTGTDKWGGHWYVDHYKTHFEPVRRRKLNVLEIGVFQGASLRTWKSFFPRSHIYGIDIDDKRAHEEYRITTFQGSQDDPEFLRRVVNEIGTVDIVIDDGSHVSSHVITSFRTLFPLLNENGIYVVEDTQTSYWPSFGGNPKDFNDLNTTMGYFKSLVDGLNFEEYPRNDYVPSYYDKHIVSAHFYHNLVFIYKGVNNEGSINKPIIS